MNTGEVSILRLGLFCVCNKLKEFDYQSAKHFIRLQVNLGYETQHTHKGMYVGAKRE